MRRRGGQIVFSPGDLCRFLDSRFSSWMDRLAIERPGTVEPDESTAADDVVRRRGREHERAVLARLRDSGLDVFEVPQSRRAEATLEALRDGREVIYQASLSQAPFAGVADFLLRVDGGSSLGSFHYEPLEAKLSRSAKPAAAIQLCAYAEMLAAVQERRPRRLHVALGNGETVELRTVDHLFYFRSLRAEFLSALDEFDPDDPPVPDPGREHRPWRSHAQAELERIDHLSLVANITRSQIDRLEAAGVRSVTQLARCSARRIARLDDASFERLRGQARLQVESSGLARPRFEILRPPPAEPSRGLGRLPPRSTLDVYLDMEGYPLGREPLEYLFGAVLAEDDDTRFVDLWAHDAMEERRAFEAFVDLVVDRRRRDDGMHVYHYGAYEVSALKRLMGRHGTREREMDSLLRAEVFVDLYRVVRDGVRVGEPRYSIKNLEHLYRDRRAGQVETAVDSIVYYDRWLESGEPPDHERSELLQAIRDYNRDDCDSTLQLAEWLRAQQDEHGIAWAGPEGESRDRGEPAIDVDLDRLTHGLAERAGPGELLAHLIDFHRRESRPMWWTMFERHARSEDELIEDLGCLGGLVRQAEPPRPGDRGRTSFAYRIDAEQDTKLQSGDSCMLAHDLTLRATLEELDLEAGRASIALDRRTLGQAGGSLPRRISLIPDEYVPAGVIERSIREQAIGWLEGRSLPRGLQDFLERRTPRPAGREEGPLVRPGRKAGDEAIEAAVRMDRTTLSIQGPPGTGKTTVASRIVLELLHAGKRVGVTSNSHKAVTNLMSRCAELSDWSLACLKVGGSGEDPLFERCSGARHRRENRGTASLLQHYPLVGGTAWLFSRPEMAGCLDTLIVDEAGQVSVANLTGMARAASNLLLVGDHMQLPQPTQGTHPGRSGLSTLDYLLEGEATVPASMGVFLDTTWRLHPRLCEFVSDAFYEGRLRPAGERERRVVRWDGGPEAGLMFVPVEHEGNTQASEEEVGVVQGLVDALRQGEHTGLEGELLGPIRESDILVVAPYNLQVRKLQRAVPEGVRVGTVDRFQGQQAPVVIVSMCASEGHDSPRGIEFLLNPNRLNVALSRAQSLAIVVGHPGLARTRCATIEQLRLVNLFCRIVESGSRGAP